MKIIVKTIDNLYEIEYDNFISSDKIIDKISKMEKISEKNIVLLHNNTIIKHSINEIYITINCNLYAIIQAAS